METVTRLRNATELRALLAATHPGSRTDWKDWYNEVRPMLADWILDAGENAEGLAEKIRKAELEHSHINILRGRYSVSNLHISNSCNPVHVLWAPGPDRGKRRRYHDAYYEPHLGYESQLIISNRFYHRNFTPPILSGIDSETGCNFYVTTTDPAADNFRWHANLQPCIVMLTVRNLDNPEPNLEDIIWHLWPVEWAQASARLKLWDEITDLVR